MVVLRCTQKLLVRLKQVGDLPPVESTTRLGDWYGDVLQIGSRQHLLFISERSRLPVVIPIREAKRGQVMIRMGAGNTCEPAASFDGDAIPSGSQVVVIEVRDHILYVSPADH